MKSFLICTLLFLASRTLTAQTGYKTYNDSLHGFSFSYPAAWQFKISDEPDFYMVCVPANNTELEHYADCFDSIVFYLSIYSGPLDSTLAEGGYAKQNNTYLAHDELSDTVKTFAMAGPGWKGIYHNNACGVSCKQSGYHAAAGTCQFLYFANGAQTICIQTTGRELDKDVFEKIKANFKFF